MHSLHLFCRSSSDGYGCGGGLLPLRLKKLSSFVIGTWAHAHGRRYPAMSAAVGGGQDHYAVLGISRTASSGDIKKAYRLLARKYHPDVSRDLQAGEVFKSIRLAYEVLSDEVARARYDTSLRFPESISNPRRRRWDYSPEYEETVYRWAKLRQQMQYERQTNYSQNSTWYHQTDSHKEPPGYERGSFGEVLRFAFFTIFFMQTMGHRASLALCGVAALLDRRLDIGYKMGYVVAWIFGGRGGILLALCIYFASWLCGKKSSSFVALVVLAMWVGANIARFAPLPQGAVLTLLYMSIKLHVDSK